MLPLADAARCRSEADWLVGINGTRAMTAFNSRDGGFYLTTVGRVQTPTLAIVVEREDRIRALRPRDYFEVDRPASRPRPACTTVAGSTRGFSSRRARTPTRAERLWDEASRPMRSRGLQGPARHRQRRSQAVHPGAPQLFDLTSLQREANGRFGFSAKTTLSLAQALYEKHKVLTYPRTDSQGTCPRTTSARSRKPCRCWQEQPFAQFAKQILEEWGCARTSGCSTTPRSATTSRSSPRCRRRARSAMPSSASTTWSCGASSRCSSRRPNTSSPRASRGRAVRFKTEGKVLVNAGWLAIYGRSGDEGRRGRGGRGQGRCHAGAGPARAKKCSPRTPRSAPGHPPPARYNEGTLLSAMEGAGKLIEDDELREAMAEKGPGHAGHARRHHRGPDRRELPAARRP
jgi:DNA topoisomerase-3